MRPERWMHRTKHCGDDEMNLGELTIPERPVRGLLHPGQMAKEHIYW